MHATAQEHKPHSILWLIWCGSVALMRREVRRFFRIWTQTFVPPVITTSLYFLIFGKVIGSQLAPIGNVEFIAFIIPGLVLMAVINSSYSNISTSFFSQKFSGSIDEILISPLPLWAMFCSLVSASVLRGLMTGALVLACGFYFYPNIEVQNPFLVLLVMIVVAVISASFGFVNGLFAKTFDHVAIVPTFVIMPLTYMGGLFYSVNRLPEPFRTISGFNPIRYMIDAFRHGFFGSEVSDTHIGLSLFLLIFTASAGISIALFLLLRGKGVRR